MIVSSIDKQSGVSWRPLTTVMRNKQHATSLVPSVMQRCEIREGSKMRTLFGRRLVTDPAVLPVEGLPADGLEAYKEGRADERHRLQRDGVNVDRATSDAYDRGRRDERMRHRGSPLLAIVTIVLVVIAVVFLFLAVKTGSFSNAGAVIDNLIQNPVHAAADKAGSALENAGQSLKSSAAPTHP